MHWWSALSLFVTADADDVKFASESELLMCTVQGDSGGPYACKDQQNSWTLIGINSFVFNSCEQSVVARVSSYVDWIQQTIASNP